MDQDNILIIGNLINNLEKKIALLEETKKRNNVSGFEKLKSDCLEIQKQLDGVLK